MRAGHQVGVGRDYRVPGSGWTESLSDQLPTMDAEQCPMSASWFAVPRGIEVCLGNARNDGTIDGASSVISGGDLKLCIVPLQPDGPIIPLVVIGIAIFVLIGGAGSWSIG